jgi:TonB family protein
MAFRALLVSKSPDTNAAMTAACKGTGIRVEVCSDIFTAIENAKTRAFSCVIADWADQPEASFLLKRARESASNCKTVAIAIVDHEPTAAEMTDNRLDFLIYRPISSEEAQAVLVKASEQMPPSSGEDAAESSGQSHANRDESNAASVGAQDDNDAEQDQQNQRTEKSDANAADDHGEIAAGEWEKKSWISGSAVGLRGVCAATLILAAAFFLWRSRDTIEYLSHTPEGRMHVLKESVAGLFYANQTGALPVSSAGSDAQQDAYFSRGPASSNVETPGLEVAATESTMAETRMPLPKAPDFPLPVPVFEHQEPAPVRVLRVAIPESMRNSPPIERPLVVAVNPAQMMPVSTPPPQPVAQQFSEPVSLTEQAARALLVQSVDPVYPPEGLAQKLHGLVVLQAVIGRDGGVEDLKIVRGNFVLSRAAIAAVKQWKFQPYSVNGHNAATQTLITINFSSPQG